jgi:hypothetical protein
MRRGETYLPEPFELDEGTLAWIAQKMPTVDVEETYAIFVDKALAKGWRYRDWQAAFRNYIRSAKLYGGVVYKASRESDPRWSLIHQARKEGFRDPEAHETPQSYASAFTYWKTQPRPVYDARVIDFSKVLKRV